MRVVAKAPRSRGWRRVWASSNSPSPRTVLSVSAARSDSLAATTAAASWPRPSNGGDPRSL